MPDRDATPRTGADLLQHPIQNKSTAFTHEERKVLGLEGLLPHAVSTMDQQAERAYQNIVRKDDPLEKYIGLGALHDRNERLFFRVLSEHLEELLPIVYTPTVGRAAQQFSRIFRRARGLWITPAQRGRVDAVLGNAPQQDVRLIVATDNERILGLGDLGAGGMLIPIGKLAIYTAAAGIHPAQVLPVSLDVGTDNAELRADPLYLGWPEPRVRGAAYDALLEEFVVAVQRRFPRALLQWEDFKKDNAFALLERYRTRLPSFNDDIQGTGAVALAAVLAGARRTGIPLHEQRVLLVGAGEAGLGIAQQIRAALARAGLSSDALLRALAIVDRQGLVLRSDAGLDPRQAPFAWPDALARSAGVGAERDLLAVVRALRPTALIGTTGQRGIFSEEVVRAMAAGTGVPVVLPMSNPTSQSEATPADVIAWTGGRALVATGSPFPSVAHEGRVLRIAQANNFFVFPGVGLGALVSGAREVTDGMFSAAAEALAAVAAGQEDGGLLPRPSALRMVAARVAAAVAREAWASGVASSVPVADLDEAVAQAMWRPEYPPAGSDA
jgi:malate dehydrogenase (oxaloacetate-decarboxylating)